jgi:hypothetical protein
LLRIIAWYEVSYMNCIPSINWPPLCHTSFVYVTGATIGF